MTIFSGSVLVGGLVHLEKRKQKGKKKKEKDEKQQIRKEH